MGAFAARYVEEAYPLAEMDITKADEAPVLARHGLAGVRKSGCWMCPHQPIGWWWALREREPARFQAAVEYERAAASRTRPVLRIFGDIPLEQAVEEWRARHPEATVEDILDKTYQKGCERRNPACEEGAGRPL